MRVSAVRHIQAVLLILLILAHQSIFACLQAARAKPVSATGSLHHLQDATETEKRKKHLSSLSAVAPAHLRMKPSPSRPAGALMRPSRASTRFCYRHKTTVGSDFPPKQRSVSGPARKAKSIVTCHCSAPSRLSGDGLPVCPLGRFYFKRTPLQVPMFQLKFNKSRFSWEWKINRLNSAPIKSNGGQGDKGHLAETSG